MVSSFSELQAILIAQRQLIAALGDFHAEISSDEFNPMEFTVHGFTGYETPETITKYVLEGVPENRAHFQLSLIGSSIELLRTASQLIDAQKSYERLSAGTPANEPSSVKEDEKGFEVLLETTLDLNKKHREENLPLTLDQDDFFASIAKITDEYWSVANNNAVSADQTQNANDLLKRIYELRIVFAEVALQRTDSVIKNISADMEAVLLVKKCIDEGILNPSTFVNKMIDTTLAEKATQIAEVLVAHTTIHSFLSKTHEMDRGNDGLQDFDPDTYTPASILGITKFTP